MARVAEAEFIALTGCALTSDVIAYILDAADRDVTDFIAAYQLTVSADVAHDGALLYAKAHLAERYRYDGTFDVSTLNYSHKGGTEQTIEKLKKDAELVLKRGDARRHRLYRRDY